MGSDQSYVNLVNLYVAFLTTWYQVRQLAGIGFADPDGLADKDTNLVSRVVLAEVRFSPDPVPLLPINATDVQTVLLPEIFIIITSLTPCTSKYQDFDKVYHFSVGIPMSSSTPPRNPIFRI